MKLLGIRLFNRGTLKAGSTALFNERRFYQAFSRDIKTATTSITIESPFVTIRRAKEIEPLLSKAIKRDVRVTVYTRTPSHHKGQLRQQAIKGIAILRQAGIKVIECSDMRHRKIGIIDRRILWEGGLNMLSQNGSKELMRRTVSCELSYKMKKITGVKW